MQNSDDDDLGFEEELMDDSFDGEFDESYDEFDDVSGGIPDQEWDEDSEEEFVEDDFGTEKKKSGLSFNTIVIGGAVILGLGVFAFQVMTKKPSEVVTKFASALNMSGATDGPIFGEKGDPSDRGTTPSEEEVAETEEGEKGFLFEPEVLDEVEASLNDSPPMPSPVAQIVETEGVTAEDDIIVLESMEGQESSKEAIIVDTEIDSVDMINEMAKEEASEIVETLSDDVAEEAEAIENFEVNPPSIEQDEPVLATVKQPEIIETTTNLSSVEKKLDMIVSRLDGMEAKISEIRETTQSQVKNLKKEVASLASSKEASSSSKPVTKATQKKSSPKKVVLQTTSWELRAAQPGKAWVSEKGKKQIKPVSVGDDLAGIGRITDISYISNQWVVQGTSGKIQQ